MSDWPSTKEQRAALLTPERVETAIDTLRAAWLELSDGDPSVDHVRAQQPRRRRMARWLVMCEKEFDDEEEAELFMLQMAGEFDSAEYVEQADPGTVEAASGEERA